MRLCRLSQLNWMIPPVPRYGNTSDPEWNLRRYSRTRQQNIDLGLAAPEGGTTTTEET